MRHDAARPSGTNQRLVHPHPSGRRKNFASLIVHVVRDLVRSFGQRLFAGESLAIFCLRVARDPLDHDSTMPIGAVDYMASGRETSRYSMPLPSGRRIVSNVRVDTTLKVGR